MADEKMQAERCTLSLMHHKWLREDLNPGHFTLYLGLFFTILLSLFFFFPFLYLLHKVRLSLVQSENLKEPWKRKGFEKWVNSYPKHSVYGRNTCRYVYSQGQSKVQYKNKVWLLLKATLQNQMVSIPQDTYQTDFHVYKLVSICRQSLRK